MGTLSMRSLKAALAVMAALAPMGPAFAQNNDISMLHEQVLENIGIAGEGYRLDSYGINRINAGETANVALDVPAGVDVVIMGDCDKDCMALDLGVSSLGKLLGEDRADDFYPIVRFNAGNLTRLDIELDLESCAYSYCYVAYSVFIQGE